MCYGDDAINWTGLNDTRILYLSDEESENIFIQGNYSATHIAVRFIGETEGNIIYANNLDSKGSMSVGRSTYPIYKYLNIWNSGKEGNKWKISVHNPLSNTSIYVYFNTKMCNEGDARNWTGLKDISGFILPPNETRVVIIQENWFATCVALSYMGNGKRLVTYTNNLNTNGGINVMNNYI